MLADDHRNVVIADHGHIGDLDPNGFQRDGSVSSPAASPLRSTLRRGEFVVEPVRSDQRQQCGTLASKHQPTFTHTATLVRSKDVPSGASGPCMASR